MATNSLNMSYLPGLIENHCFSEGEHLLEEHTSGSQLIQTLKEDVFAREHIAQKKGIAKSSFFEAMNDRGLDQFLYVF